MSLDWFHCLYKYALAESTTPRIYGLFDQEEAVLGMFFCVVQKSDNTLYGMTNFYTMEFAPVSLSASTSLADAVALFVDYIASERPKWNKIDLRLMREELLDNINMFEILSDRNFSVPPFFMYDNWFLEVSGRDFESYYASRGSRLRNTIRRKENKLKKTHDYTIELVDKPGPEMVKATKDYETIYNSSWKKPEAFPEFSPQLIELCATLGFLRLGVLYIDSKPAAAQLWINTKTTAMIYKLAYDEEFSAFSAGSILSREMFRHAIDVDRVAEIDYGIGGENYKKDWMEGVRKFNGLLAFNKKTPTGLALSVVDSAKAFLKRFK